MKIEKIKPVPKYIVERIKQYDKAYTPAVPGRTRFYSYLTKNDGELVKVTVAVKNHYKQWLYKQVAVHGLNSEQCFVKDMVFHYISGYQVGWYEQGLQKFPRWYESSTWTYAEDKYFDPFAPIVNREYLDKFPEYKYSAVNLYRGVNILKYLRFYKQYPQIEYLMKAGLCGYAFSSQILKEIGKNKHFCKWLMKNRAEIMQNGYYVDVILRAFRTTRPLAELQAIHTNRLALAKAVGISELKAFFKGDTERFVTYLDEQKTSVYSYNDYFKACNYLSLDMSENKNRYPHDFKRWHDIRIDEYNTAKALKDEQERKALYDKFAAVASKYLGLEYDKKSVYIAII
ncbi:MAG: PcfJ domain-containing protein, partial [Candidatus Scatosoma sp.]